MRLALERRRLQAHAEVELVEVVMPRTNLATLRSAENLVGAVGLAGSFALEIAADDQHRRFLVRAADRQLRRHLEAQLGAAYPQAHLRHLEAGADPAVIGADEQVAACTLELRAPAFLPIRTFTDLDLDAERTAQADPLLGILAAAGDLPGGWRALSQLVLRPAPEDWCGADARHAVQHPLAHERVPTPTDTTLPSVLFVCALLGVAALGMQAYVWFQSGLWLQLVGLLAASLAGVPLAVAIGRRLLRPRIYDMDLVREKVSRTAYQTELRLAVIAPAQAPPTAVASQLQRLAAAYRHYNLAGANGFVSKRMSPPVAAAGLRWPVALRPARRTSILSTVELAGLWHLPHAAADVPLLERTTARRWLPLPGTVAGSCRIGVSVHQGRQVCVALPEDALQRHLLLVAKTRRGKSTLLLRLALHAMQVQPRHAVLVIDPHKDLAEAVLGLVPSERRQDVIYLDVGDSSRPVGLNLLDTGLGWSRDRAVANSLAVFQHEWGERFWGPRMEDAFRFALLSLLEANMALCAADPAAGRRAQYTLLDVPPLLCDAAFRCSVLSAVGDPSIRRWWSEYFESLERRFQLEIVNPVLTKIHRFQGTQAARRIVGQPVSTVQPADWLRRHAIVVVHTARSTLGDNAAALIGGTLLNLASLSIAEQASLEPAARAPISMFVDEFHTMPGADYETILAELSKYGANLVLATQSLARLIGLGGDDGRGLRAMVFANLDGLFAFNCSAEDARYLVPELGGALDEQDLVELGEHQCYVRLSTGGERLPTFSVRLDPPLPSDSGLRAELAAASAARYGRPAADVEADLQAAVARIQLTHVPPPPQPPAPVAAEHPPDKPRRNEHRPRKKRSKSQSQPQLQHLEVTAHGRECPRPAAALGKTTA